MLAAGVIAAMEFDSPGREPVRTGANRCEPVRTQGKHAFLKLSNHRRKMDIAWAWFPVFSLLWDKSLSVLARGGVSDSARF